MGCRSSIWSHFSQMTRKMNVRNWICVDKVERNKLQRNEDPSQASVWNHFCQFSDFMPTCRLVKEKTKRNTKLRLLKCTSLSNTIDMRRWWCTLLFIPCNLLCMRHHFCNSQLKSSQARLEPNPGSTRVNLGSSWLDAWKKTRCAWVEPSLISVHLFQRKVGQLQITDTAT